MGSSICRHEASRIYFSAHEAKLSKSAREVLVRLAGRLNICADQTIVLIAVSGDDGLPAPPNIVAERLGVVQQTLVSQAISPARIETVTDGPLLERVPKGPIGGIVIVTKP
ncbi:hypothetical protein [Candidatus Phycosocius spiralis]|uniref:Uncharacterized protein n=1 Tax=Candidatus Phycosocius spiralis TaxID=2815099 RepID=A0ABQ4PVE0_9PROT|nr:hypothetical protein [Candidatus Phycosocius spiralis]GIU66990.1 hypothetical protein PsB1_1144 [Candidatus Phycosocius spiralis]